MKSGEVPPSDEAWGATSRRRFLKACGTAAIALFVDASCSKPRKETAPVWTAVPAQVWTVGVPVHLNLAAYCTDADGDTLTFELDQPLPSGLSLNGSVISGTPSAVFTAKQFVATADDHS